jgi:hypothetical protein
MTSPAPKRLRRLVSQPEVLGSRFHRYSCKIIDEVLFLRGPQLPDKFLQARRYGILYTVGKVRY